MTPDEQAKIDAYSRTALELASIRATDADVQTFGRYVRLSPAGVPYIAGGLPVPQHGRGTYAVAPPAADDPPRTTYDVLGGGKPLPLSPVQFALDLAASGMITTPLGFRRESHSWSAPHNAT